MTSTVSPGNAHDIMGKNFLGLTEVRMGYRIAYTNEQLRQLAEVPFSEETLQACKDTHVLVAGAPLSLNEIRNRADGDFSTDWFFYQEFANEKKVSVRWYLLRKEQVPESRHKSYDEQVALLTEEEEVPLACEVTYMVILYWLTHHERLLPDVHVRCQDKSSDGLRVCVGGFGRGGLFVDDDWDGHCHSDLGLASSVPPRKS